MVTPALLLLIVSRCDPHGRFTMYRPDDTGGAAHSCAAGHTTCDKLLIAELFETMFLSFTDFALTGDTRKIFVSNIKTVDESHSARVLIGCKPINFA